jgi:hypothetical protein
MSVITDRSPFVYGLERCIAVCERTLEAYVAEGDQSTPFAGPILRATAALQAALGTEVDELGDLSLAIASDLAREAAATIRRHGLDERLLRCAEACERAAFLCKDVLPRAA